jgi:uncharacterized membrane protein YqaE (UPF0057 family)
MKKNLYVLIATVLFFGSCTIEKRLYMDGYHVSWHGKGAVKHVKPQTQQEPESYVVSAEPITEESVEMESPTSALEVPQANLITLPFEENSQSTNVEKSSLESSPKASRRQERQVKREIYKEAKAAIKELKSNGAYSGSVLSNPIAQTGSKPDTILLVLICLLGFSPIAMYLYEGDWTKRCTTNLILWLLCGLPGFIHALVVILGKK